MEASLFFALFGAVMLVNELGRLLPSRPREGRYSRRTLFLIQGAWYLVVALLIVSWWFGSDFAGEMLFLMFCLQALFAALVVFEALALAFRFAGAQLRRS